MFARVMGMLLPRLHGHAAAMSAPARSRSRTQVGTRSTSAELTSDDYKGIVKDFSSLVQRCSIHGSTEQCIQDNLPFLMAVGRRTFRLNHAPLRQAVLNLQLLDATQAHRWSMEMSRCMSHVVTKFRRSVRGEKLDDWVKTLGESIGLQYGPSGLTKATSPDGHSTLQDSLEDTPPPTPPRCSDDRRRVFKQFYGVSPPPCAQRAVPEAAASRACVEIVSSQDVEASPVKRTLKAIAGNNGGEGEKRAWKWGRGREQREPLRSGNGWRFIG